ncbi:MAG: hypothetical protein KHZ83_01725 [Roseburia sp.]|nr:hypothetical protein [Roseburia sp.]
MLNDERVKKAYLGA